MVKGTFVKQGLGMGTQKEEHCARETIRARRAICLSDRSNRSGLSEFSEGKHARLALTLAFLAIVLCCNACTPSNRSSVLMIMVEELGFSTFSCQDSDGTETDSGLQVLCAEAVRFTHAYTPSVLTQATAASVLTGLYPQETGVWHNGSQFVSSKVDTVAEVARRKGYRTSFFSGGPPIWRKAGISQGFEVFDDNIQLSPRRLYRPVVEMTNLFLNWRESESARAPFFSVLFLPDLQFDDSPTVNDLGVVRESSFKSRFEEVDEALGVLFRQMKQQRIWDSTSIFLVGLSAHPEEENHKQIRALDLFSEGTRVALLIKPASKLKEEPGIWKVDTNVSLVDVGTTLYNLFDHKPPISLVPGLRSYSLDKVLSSPKVDWPMDRLVLSESAWSEWHAMGPPRLALRSGPYLYLRDHPPQFFDTLSDNLEVSPLRESEIHDPKLREHLSEFFSEFNPPYFTQPAAATLEKLELGRDLWAAGGPRADATARLKLLSTKYPDDRQLLGWRAIWAIRQENWNELKALATKPLQSAWAFVAARNLGQKQPPPPDEPCLRMFFGPLKAKRPSLRECNSPDLIDLLTWLDESQSASSRQRGLESFLRFYVSHLVDEKVAERNYSVGVTWDVPLNKPAGPGPEDLILALPENKKFRQVLAHRLSEAGTVK